MKRGGLFLVAAMGLAVLSFSPSVDGRATVAPLGELPQGMFAKTVGYLPGDSITVTNLAEHNTIDVLVVGALDASQGIAISLSPEAARMLGIKAGSDVMVKLTRRNGMMDEVVTGSAVLTPGDDSAAPSKAASSLTSDTSPSGDTSVAKSAPEGTSENAPMNASTLPAGSKAPAAGVVAAKTGEAASYNDAPVPNPAEPTAAQRELSSPPPAVIVPAPVTAPAQETVAETSPMGNVGKTEEFGTGAKEPLTEEVPAAESRPIVASAADRVPSAPVVEPAVTETAARPPRSESPTTVSPCGETLAVSETPAIAVLPEKDLPEPEIEETTAESNYAPDSSYAPIVLVPATAKVPEEVAVPKKPQKASPVETLVSAKEEAVPVSARPALENARGGIDDTISSLTRQSIGELDKGAYYVQFATFSSKTRVEDALKKYGVDYPMAFVPSRKATQAMIGPLTMDEYGAVLARFKSDGFGDAFLRKIK